MQLLKPLILILCLQLFFIQHGTSQSCYELVWSDEFNYSGKPDPDKWTHEVNGDGGGNDELQYYTNRLENSRVEDSVLVIEAHKKAYEGKQYTSARLITYHNNLSWKYGKIEARIKLPKGQGLWPAFWMLGDQFFEGTSWPGCGEIDIMEMIGGGEGRDDTAHGTIHYKNNNGDHAQNGQSTQLETGIFNDDFHVFSMEWNDRLIRWFLDGKPYYGVNITSDELSEFHENFFLILNVAIGGDWPGSPNASTQFPQQMLVDYVRVYQKGTLPEINGKKSVIKSENNIEYSVYGADESTYNWIVPEGASIVNGQGTQKVSINWGCKADTLKCELTTPCSSYVLTCPVSISSLEITGKAIISSFEKGEGYSIPATSEPTYLWSLPIGVDTDSTLFSNHIYVNWADKNGIIHVNLENSCGEDSASLAVKTVPQKPYPDENQPHNIPGTIEAVHYDTGGEGIAYHDFDPNNRGPGIRQNEGVDSEFSIGAGNVGYIEAGEWLEYSVELKESNLYDLDIKVASIYDSGKFSILFDGIDKSGVITAPNTGSWKQFTSVIVNNVSLKEAYNRMRVEIIEGDFNLASINFTVSDANSVDQRSENANFVYPTLVKNRLSILNLNGNVPYVIYNISGTKVKVGMLKAEMPEISLDLPNGVYFIQLLNDKFGKTSRFIVKR